MLLGPGQRTQAENLAFLIFQWKILESRDARSLRTTDPADLSYTGFSEMALMRTLLKTTLIFIPLRAYTALTLLAVLAQVWLS